MTIVYTLQKHLECTVHPLLMATASAIQATDCQKQTVLWKWHDKHSFSSELTILKLLWPHLILTGNLVFHFLQHDMVFGIINPFLCIFNAASSEKSFPIQWVSCSHTLMSGQQSFTHLLNPDWSIQISCMHWKVTCLPEESTHLWQ